MIENAHVFFVCQISTAFIIFMKIFINLWISNKVMMISSTIIYLRSFIKLILGEIEKLPLSG